MINQLMRYLPLCRLVAAEPRDVILEVGGGERGLNLYLPEAEIVGVDTGYEGDAPQAASGFRRIKGSALRLPFRDGAFNLVVCSDMLEHIAPADRERAVNELLRVGAGTIFLSFPVKETYGPWEERLFRWYEFSGKEPPDWLLDHRSKGLPEEAEVAAMLGRLGVEFSVVSNENNLAHFLIMVLESSFLGGYLSYIASVVAPERWRNGSRGPLADLTRLLFYPLRALPRLMDFGSPVRKIFVIRKAAAGRSGLSSKIAGYYDRHPNMISSPFGGVRGEPGAGDAYLSETLERLGIGLEGKRVLDVGCGSGWLARYCRGRAGSYYGADISALAVELTRKVSGNVVQADAQSLPFPDASFDIVFCVDSFEHIPDQDAAVKEFGRVLSGGGRVFLSVPNYSNMAGLVKLLGEFSGLYEKDSWAPFDHWAPQVLERFMTPARVKEVFSRNGFSRFSVIGGRRDLLDGLFPWINHRAMPFSASAREFFSRFQGPLERFYWLSLHNFWSIGK